MSMSRETASSCDSYLQQKEEWRNFKRNPHLRPISERIKMGGIRTRTATAAGFAIIDEYHRHKHSQDTQMCQIAYEFYIETHIFDPYLKELRSGRNLKKGEQLLQVLPVWMSTIGINNQKTLKCAGWLMRITKGALAKVMEVVMDAA